MGLPLAAYCFQSSCLLRCTYSNDMVINKLMEVFFKQTSFGHTVFSANSVLSHQQPQKNKPKYFLRQDSRFSLAPSWETADSQESTVRQRTGEAEPLSRCWGWAGCGGSYPALPQGWGACLPGGGSCHAYKLGPFGCLPAWQRTDCWYLSCASTGDCNPQGYQPVSAPFTSNENCILKLHGCIPIYPKKRWLFMLLMSSP